MQQLRDVVRAKVDDMRSSGFAQAHSSSEVAAALSNSVPASSPTALSKGGPEHACPWHTCQATRHG